MNLLEDNGRLGYAVSTGQPLDSLGEQILGVLSAEERRKIGINSHRGLRGRFDRELATGGAPFGYRNAPLGGGVHRKAPGWEGSRLEVVEDQADVVRRIFAERAQGEGLRAIAHRLNTAGIASPRAKGWAPSALLELLRNPIYRGE